MAFWKHFGKKSTLQAKSHQETKQLTPTTLKNNVKLGQDKGSAISLAANGDLGESLHSELYHNLNGLEQPKKQAQPLHQSPNGYLGDLGDELSASELMRPRSKKSRLHKNLQEILVDLTALSYFQQYLESKEGHAVTFLSLLNDIKNCNLLANSLSTLGNDEVPEPKWSPNKNEPTKTQRLLNSTSSSSGFSDDMSIESPGHLPFNSFRSKRPETETMLHSLHSEQRRIIQKYFDPESSDFLPTIASQFKLNEHYSSSEACSSTVEIVLELFNDVQENVLNLLDSDYLPDYLHSEFHYRYQLDILTGGKLYITDILYNDTCLFYFMEFMDQEGKRHWIEFWLAANNFRTQWNAHNASDDALIIYNKYFSLQASQSLGLLDAMRSAIEENICSGSAPGPDCFEHAVNVVLCAMEKKYLQKFLASQVYHQYLTEIIGSLKNPAVSNYKLISRSKRSGSSSTINSEVSGVSASVASTTASIAPAASNAGTPLVISTSNVSTGMTHAESTMIRLISGISNESLVIDIRHLNDPDSLWQRKKYKLSLGYLTPLGRFCTEVEPLPDKKSESKLSKAVRKFVLVDEDPEKEEAAWQTAEVIVRDITSIKWDSRESIQSHMQITNERTVEDLPPSNKCHAPE